MPPLTVSKAKATFSGVAREVIRTRNPVTVRTPHGYIQIIPWDAPEQVPDAPHGSLKLSRRERKLRNTFGDSL